MRGAVRWPQHLIVRGDAKQEYFDLDRDPAEADNLITLPDSLRIVGLRALLDRVPRHVIARATGDNGAPAARARSYVVIGLLLVPAVIALVSSQFPAHHLRHTRNSRVIPHGPGHRPPTWC